MAEKRDPKKTLKWLKDQRTWKKGAVTKRINNLDELVDTWGSKRVTRTAIEGLLKVFDELKQVCDDISYMCDEIDDLNNLEDTRLRVEICVAKATEMLEARENEASTVISNETSSWVAKHAMMPGNESEFCESEVGRGSPMYVVGDTWQDDTGTCWNNSPLFDGGTGARQRYSESINRNFSTNQVSTSESMGAGYSGRQPHSQQFDANLTSMGVYDETTMDELQGMHNMDRNYIVRSNNQEYAFGGMKSGMGGVDRGINLNDIREQNKHGGSVRSQEPGNSRNNFVSRQDNFSQGFDISHDFPRSGHGIPESISSRNLLDKVAYSQNSRSALRARNNTNFTPDFSDLRPPPGFQQMDIRVTDNRRTLSDVGARVSGSVSHKSRSCVSDNTGHRGKERRPLPGAQTFLHNQDQSFGGRGTIHAGLVASGYGGAPAGVDGARTGEVQLPQNPDNGGIGASGTGVVASPLAGSPVVRPRNSSLDSSDVDQQSICRSDVRRRVPGSVPDQRTTGGTGGDGNSLPVQNQSIAGNMTGLPSVSLPIQVPGHNGAGAGGYYVQHAQNSLNGVASSAPALRQQVQNPMSATAGIHGVRGVHGPVHYSQNQMVGGAGGGNAGCYAGNQASGPGNGSFIAPSVTSGQSLDDSGSHHSTTSSSSASGNIHGGHTFYKQPAITNEVDTWIDELTLAGSDTRKSWTQGAITPGVMMSWMVQQNLPQMELPTFTGSSGDWVKFITKFRDVIHLQEYLNDGQRMRFLMQQLKGEAEKAVSGFANDSKGYVLALKKLKKLFGQRQAVAQAVLAKVTKGKPIQIDDVKGLSEFLYNISDCLITLKQLNYVSDLHSSDTLQQALQRLPARLISKWSERSQVIRKQEEPSLVHLESWLQDRVLAIKETDRCLKRQPRKKVEEREEKFAGTTLKPEEPPVKFPPCLLCKKDGHPFSKCSKYKELPPLKRMQTVKGFGLCFNCLTEGHSRKDCSSKHKCFESGCEHRHHTTLHGYFLERERIHRETEEKRKKDQGKKDKDGGKKVSDGKKDDDEEKLAGMTTVVEEKLAGLTTAVKKEVILQIVPVTLHSPDGEMFDTHALLDGGSQVTLVREDVSEKLRLNPTEKDVAVRTVKDDAETLTAGAVSLEVSDRNGENWFEIEEAITCKPDRFNMPRRPRLSDRPDSEMYRHLEGLDLQEIHPDEVTILIGGDVADAHTPVEVRKGSKGQPVARKMPFGWCVFGPSVTGGEDVHSEAVYSGDEVQSLWDVAEKPPALHVGLVLSEEERVLHHSLERFWLQEHYGILPSNELSMSKEDERALAVLEKETKNVGDRYEVPMLWVSPEVSLPNNYAMALRRFQSTEKRLRGDKELRDGCKAVMDGYLTVDPPYARKMTPEEARTTSERTWHMPVHPVTNPHKPGKIRLVNDGAAEYQGVSLNKKLVTGPDQLSSLVGILMRLRTNRVAIAADIEAMFHQVRVTKKDTDSLRFLWKDDFCADGPPDTYQMLVHIFGAKDSSTCCSYAVKRVARDNWERFDPVTLEAALKAFYVDDLLKSLHDEDTAILVALQLIALLKLGGFRLCKFVSNSKKVLEALPESEISPSAVVSLDESSETSESKSSLERALGVLWDTVNDVFTFTSSIKDAPMTKRGILRTTSSLFDPLGFLTPFVLKAKILLQDLWRKQLNWDELVNDAHQKYWKKWLEGASVVSQVRLNRWYLKESKPVQEIQLHIYCDASELAYGCVAYLRYSFKDGTHDTAFVMSKSRLAPIKAVTLPRLELNAARCGARLSQLILQEIDLPIEVTKFWSDSTLALQYIRNDRHRMKVFVANAQAAILELSEASQWNHIRGKDNPADLLTRGVISPVELTSSKWFTGPDYLLEDEETWPKSDVEELSEADLEIRTRSVLVALGMAVELKKIDVTRFGSWLRLKRVIAWVLRFPSNCRQAAEDRDMGPLSVDDLKDAEHMIVKDVQASSFQEEITTITEGKPLPTSNRLSSLCPFIDNEGVLRVGGRLANLNIPMEMKHPPILERNHHATKLLIEWTHRRNGHVGTDHVLALIREAYWILSGRIAINQVVHRCFFCRVKRARQQYPYMADLPQCRAAIDQPPFDQCGVDLFGPINVKQGRKKLKRWACLFSCLTIRCVHLEIVNDCETDTFIDALRRFVGRRGSPSNMYSDNGTNFKGATSELKEFIQSLDQEAIVDFATTNHIKWTFNPPKAPHMGGAWERLVRSVKEVMFGLLQQQNRNLTDSQLLTLLIEAESIVNSRPLTYFSESPNDLGALTPNHILLGRHRSWASIKDTSELDICSRKKYKQVQALTANFWTRWRSEYLPTLTTRPKGWREKIPNFNVGDLVLVHDDSTKKRLWPLARIEEIIPGSDGVVRVAKVRTKTGVYTRPVTKLYHLEEYSQGGEDVGNLANNN